MKYPVTETTSLKFYRQRQVPYGLREKIEEELFDLTKARLIEPIHYLEWTAPIVPVLKNNGKVRICGDYRLTVNQMSKCDTYLICIENIDKSGEELCTGGKRSIGSNFWSTKISPIPVKYRIVLVSEHKPLLGLLGEICLFH